MGTQLHAQTRLFQVLGAPTHIIPNFDMLTISVSYFILSCYRLKLALMWVYDSINMKIKYVGKINRCMNIVEI